MMRQLQAYETDDGKLFNSLQEAEAHERKALLAKEMAKIQRYYEDDATDSVNKLRPSVVGGNITWGQLLEWLEDNQEDVSTVLEYLSKKT